MERFSVYFVTGLTIGILTTLGIISIPWAIAIAGVSTLIVTPSPMLALGAAIVTLGIGCGVIRVQSIPDPSTLTLTANSLATITSVPQIHGSTSSARATIQGRNVLLLFKTMAPEIGSIIQFSGHNLLLKPATNPGQFDSKKRYTLRRQAPPVIIDSFQIIGKNSTNPLISIAAHMREEIVRRVVHTIPHPYSDMIIGLTLGEIGVEIPDTLFDSFRLAGLTHLLVVSGSQVALILGIASHLLGRMRLPIVFEAGLLTLTNCFFYFLCGGGASVLRAIIMSEISIVNRSLKNRTSPLFLMSVTLILFLMIDPTLIIDTGAILSFAATGALIWGVPTLSARFPTNWPQWIVLPISTSVAPFLVTFPILWAQFYSVSLIGLITNVIVIGFVEVLVVVGIISELGMLVFPTIFVIGLEFCRSGIWALNSVASISSQLPLATAYLGHPPFTIPCILGLGISGWMIDGLIPNPQIRRGVILGSGGVLLVYILVQITSPKYLKVISIDVDQGDSTLIITPERQTIMIDTGNRIVNRLSHRVIFDAATERILPVLNYYGIRKVDYLIITHFDQDHIGGTYELMRRIPIGQIITNGHNTNYPQWNFGTIPQNTCPDSATLTLDSGVKLDLFNLKDALVENENDHSIVTKVTFGDFSMLMTGDLEAPGEYHLVSTLGSTLSANLLKLGHHGSKTSSSEVFLDTVRPRFAIISAGRHNKYGHPHPAVLNRIHRHGINEWGTYSSGAIEIRTNGNELFIEGTLPK
ncbi:DNA internalization-related competence protein ComEC/Rec2 [bacterium]|nr:DNA internalization-related competence protein ComEC/Rec2 [bacterium]